MNRSKANSLFEYRSGKAKLNGENKQFKMISLLVRLTRNLHSHEDIPPLSSLGVRVEHEELVLFLLDAVSLDELQFHLDVLIIDCLFIDFLLLLYRLCCLVRPL